MEKGGSVSAREGTALPQDAPVNAGAVDWPGLLAAEDAVAGMRAKLHLWAARDPGRRFGDLFNLIYDPAFLRVAWDAWPRTRALTPRASIGPLLARSRPGWGQGILGRLRDSLKSGEFRPVEVHVGRHAPDFFVRRADGTGVLIDVRPDDRVSAADSAVFAATAAMAGQAGWAYDRVGVLPDVRAANLRWLAGYRHPRYARARGDGALGEVFAGPRPLRAGAAEVGDPVAVLPVQFAMLWRGQLAADFDSRVLDSASTVRATNQQGRI